MPTKLTHIFTMQNEVPATPLHYERGEDFYFQHSVGDFEYSINLLCHYWLLVFSAGVSKKCKNRPSTAIKYPFFIV